jgi:uncharacterized protein
VNSVFVDTTALYALADKGESMHLLAKRTLAELERREWALLTTTDIVDEIVTLVRYRLGHRAAVKLGEKLWASRWCTIVEVSDEIRVLAWQMFVRFEDQRFSLTDCTSFATMRARRIGEAFTFDRTDFVVAGFEVVPDAHVSVRPSRKR